jgi:acyl carrier protein
MTDQEKLLFLEDALINVFKKNAEKIKGKISPESNLTTDIGLDSLDIVELQMHYEEQYNVETSTDGKVFTVRDLMNLMQ